MSAFLPAGMARPRPQDRDPKPKTIDPQNRVTIPPDVMEALNLKPGDFVTITAEDGHARIVPVKWVPRR